MKNALYDNLQDLARKGGSAYPFKIDLGDGDEVSHPGMTLRDYYAAQAIVPLVADAFTFNADDPGIPVTFEEVAGKAFAIADAMVKARDVETADDRRVRELQKKIAELEELQEALRPHWAQGYTSDSIAAQASTAALSGIWGLLNVDNQTAAVSRVVELLDREARGS